MSRYEDVEKHVDRLRLRKREPRLKDKDLFETVEEVFDKRTVLTIIELQRRKCLRTLKGVVSAGKEARVYWGKSYSGEDLAVKIYLTATAEFKKSIWKYIRGDPRFEGIGKLPTKKLMELWARKEFGNLKRMYEAGVRVPRPICHFRNVVIMEFIGIEGKRAPLLKEYHEAGALDEAEAYYIFNKVIEYIKLMYLKADLVHGDLSEYNVMIFNGEPIIIDVSQAVRLDHPNAHNFLWRDIKNIVRFFSEEVGIDVPNEEEVYKAITSHIAGEENKEQS